MASNSIGMIDGKLEKENRRALDAAKLKPIVWRLLITLIYNNVSSRLFRSTIISYYTIYS
jgi:hypothetical protein